MKKRKIYLPLFLIILFQLLIFNSCSINKKTLKNKNSSTLYDLNKTIQQSINYLKQNSITLKNAILENDFQNNINLNPINLPFDIDDLKNKNIFLIGEGHGSRANPYTTYIILKYLLSKTNIKYIFLENYTYGFASLLDLYVNTGNEYLLNLILKLYYPYIFSSNEYYTLWKNIYKLNQSLPDNKKLRIVGIEINNTGPYLLYLWFLFPDKNINNKKVVNLNCDPQIKYEINNLYILTEQYIKLFIKEEKLFNPETQEYKRDISDIKKEYQSLYEKSKKLFAEIIDNYEINKKYYKNYFKNNFSRFDEIINVLKIKQVVSIKSTELQGKSHKLVSLRDLGFYYMLKWYYEKKDGKILGQFGKWHILNTHYTKNAYTRFIEYLCSKDSFLKEKPCVIDIMYQNCYFNYYNNLLKGPDGTMDSYPIKPKYGIVIEKKELMNIFSNFLLNIKEKNIWTFSNINKNNCPLNNFYMFEATYNFGENWKNLKLKTSDVCQYIVFAKNFEPLTLKKYNLDYSTLLKREFRY